MVVVDCDGMVIFYNKVAKNKLGLEHLELTGKPFSIISHGIWQDYIEIITTGTSLLGKKRVFNGHMVIVSHNPILNKDKVVGVLSIFQDISESDKMLSEIDSYRAMIDELDAIIESIYDAIFITDGEGKALRVNSSWEKITGLRSEDVIGKNVNDLESQGYCSKSAALMVLEQKRPVTIQYRLYTGKEVLSSGNPIFDKDGNVVMVVTNVRDLTEMRRLSKQLEQTKKLTEEYHSELKQLRTQVFKHEHIISESKKMNEVFELAMRVASVDAPVLITGQTGVGKEVVARFIHEHSKRRSKGPFLKINCGAIPENLLESELFGYDKGAFTGASREGKLGLFEAAEGGTIILDEIGELSLKLQVKLLRALQDLEITRIGAVKPQKVDIRVIAITNRDLKKMVKDGTFREDFYFRLNVVPIYIPPLIERKDDLLHLINFFLRKFNKAYSKNVYLTREVVDILINYNWPGNIRELGNIIERLIVVTPHDEITATDLPDSLQGQAPGFSIGRFDGLKDAVKRLEINLIEEAIKKYGGINEAATHLKVNPTTIYRKLRSA